MIHPSNIARVADVANLNPDLREKLEALFDHFGWRLIVESGFRSTAQQWVLWNLYRAGKGNLAAYPGTSNHEHGDAADLHRTDPALSWAEVHAYAAQLGLHFPVGVEAWHAEQNPSYTGVVVTDEQIQKLAAAIAVALDSRPRQMHDYDTGLERTETARTLEEWQKAEVTQIRRAVTGA